MTLTEYKRRPGLIPTALAVKANALGFTIIGMLTVRHTVPVYLLYRDNQPIAAVHYAGAWLDGYAEGRK